MSRIARRVRRAGAYFVTTHTWKRRPLFLKPDPARILLEQLLECSHRGFYALHAFVIMPDHLHALLTPGETTSVEKVMMMIKGGSSFRIRRELNYKFPIWHGSFHDRWMRGLGEFLATKYYIEANPVAAKLVAQPMEYSFSSASGRFSMDANPFEPTAPE